MGRRGEGKEAEANASDSAFSGAWKPADPGTRFETIAASRAATRSAKKTRKYRISSTSAHGALASYVIAKSSFPAGIKKRAPVISISNSA
jgi:hypothetical protein